MKTTEKLEYLAALRPGTVFMHKSRAKGTDGRQHNFFMLRKVEDIVVFRDAVGVVTDVSIKASRVGDKGIGPTSRETEIAGRTLPNFFDRLIVSPEAKEAFSFHPEAIEKSYRMLASKSKVFTPARGQEPEVTPDELDERYFDGVDSMVEEAEALPTSSPLTALVQLVGGLQEQMNNVCAILGKLTDLQVLQGKNIKAQLKDVQMALKALEARPQNLTVMRRPQKVSDTVEPKGTQVDSAPGPIQPIKTETNVPKSWQEEIDALKRKPAVTLSEKRSPTVVRVPVIHTPARTLDESGKVVVMKQ